MVPYRRLALYVHKVYAVDFRPCRSSILQSYPHELGDDRGRRFPPRVPSPLAVRQLCRSSAPFRTHHQHKRLRSIPFGHPLLNAANPFQMRPSPCHSGNALPNPDITLQIWPSPSKSVRPASSRRPPRRPAALPSRRALQVPGGREARTSTACLARAIWQAAERLGKVLRSSCTAKTTVRRGAAAAAGRVGGVGVQAARGDAELAG